MNRFLKKQLDKNGFILGSWINTGSSVVAEIMAASGFDFLVVDVEHSAVDIEKSQRIFQAINAVKNDCVPMARLSGNSYSENKRYLDAGAMGLIAPLVNTEKEVDILVDSVKYPPTGKRGVGYGRSHGYGFDFSNYMAVANKETFVCIQLEHILGVENIDSLLSNKNIDAVFIGPYDMTASMGITADFENPEYKKVCKTILKKCREYDILPGIHVVQPDPKEVKKRLFEGYRMIAYSLDITMIGKSCREGLKEIRKERENG